MDTQFRPQITQESHTIPIQKWKLISKTGHTWKTPVLEISSRNDIVGDTRKNLGLNMRNLMFQHNSNAMCSAMEDSEVEKGETFCFIMSTILKNQMKATDSIKHWVDEVFQCC